MAYKTFSRVFTEDADAVAAAEVALRAIKESTDAFPPLKSVTAALIVLWEMSRVPVDTAFIAILAGDRAEFRLTVQVFHQSDDAVENPCQTRLPNSYLAVQNSGVRIKRMTDLSI